MSQNGQTHFVSAHFATLCFKGLKACFFFSKFKSGDIAPLPPKN